MKKIKVMKKSMFLSTILMVVLLIVALSTATFAWFSANSQVTATQTTMTAATTTDADIAIGWDSGPTGSSLVFTPVGGMKPAVPTAAPVVGTTKLSEFLLKTSDFYKDPNDNNVSKFKSGPADVDGKMIGKNSIASDTSVFYIKNNGLNDAKISVTMKIDPAIGADILPTTYIRVAMFVKNTGADPLYVGTMASDGVNVMYGAIVKDQPISSITDNYSASLELADFVTITKGAEVEVTFVAWLDGTLLGADNSGKSSKIEFTFNGTPVANPGP